MIKLTIIGWYNYNPDIFNSISVPDGLDKETVINTILLEKGEFTCLYTNPAFLKSAIGYWSDANQMAFKHLAKVIEAEYDPISNYDRTEIEEIESAGGSEQEDKVSAFNSDDYKPSAQNTIKEDNKSGRKLHAYGNIGTTTNAQMMIAEKEVVESVNPYMIIANMFADTFCVKVF